MALFNKIFFSSSATSTSAPALGNRHNIESVSSKNYFSQFPFDARQVRVLLYRECDRRGRRLLFDSSALQKVPLTEYNGNSEKLSNCKDNCNRNININNNKIGSSATHDSIGEKFKPNTNEFIEVSDGFAYKHNRPKSADITSIGEMVFGALAMSFRGTALKVHWMEAPSRMLCSQVFLSPLSYLNRQNTTSSQSVNNLTAPRNSITSDHGSIDGFSMNSFSMPLGRHQSLTISSDRETFATNPLDVPEILTADISLNSRVGGPRYSATYSTGDSGFSDGIGICLPIDQWSAVSGGASNSSYQYSTKSSLGSVTSDREPFRKFSMDSSYFSLTQGNISSDGSLQRRISRNLLTSFENQHSMSDFIGFLSDDYHTSAGGSEGCVMTTPYRRASYTNETRSNPEIGGRRRDNVFQKPHARRAKLGIAVCITMSESFEEDMELFCSEHIALLESMLGRLRALTERAYTNHKDFLPIMLRAWQMTTNWINDLFTAPRIKCPVWLSITTSGSKYSKNVAERFVKELCWLLSFADTKDTNFFISTMLTAILTHHLGWVSTVASFNSSSKTPTASVAIEQREKLLQISQKHPYNALWAQIGDLYGALGTPPKLTRTIIYGTEKISIERLLNILTYFIRCGEVRRTTKREDINKDLINSIVCQNSNDKPRSTNLYDKNSNCKSSNDGSLENNVGGTGLKRTQTCKQNLNIFSDNNDTNCFSCDETDSISIHKKNDIPNVLAFRDSRFVQQELRIGNFSMDTGIVKNSFNYLKNKEPQRSKKQQEKIRLTITTPENVELAVDGSNDALVENDECALEAIEIESNELVATIKSTAISPPATNVISLDELDCISSGENGTNNKNFFWNMAPPVREGLSWNDLEKLQDGIKKLNHKLEQRSTSANDLAEQQSSTEKKNISLSDLITENSMGKSDRMTWGIEPIKEMISPEEEKHFEIGQKFFEKGRAITQDNGNGVVFVLGENEPLVNIKRSSETLVEDPDKPKLSQQEVKAQCKHQHQHHSQQQQPYVFKKHSCVKFNFAQYPQIATNYMKNKNLDMSSCDFLKMSSKLDCVYAASERSPLSITTKTNTTTPIQCTISTSTVTDMTADDCELCKTISCQRSYQTPSNATELEFEEEPYYRNDSRTIPIAYQKSAQPSCKNSNNMSSKINTTANDDIHLLELPIPTIKEYPQEGDGCDMKLRAGFVPSLFLNITDHYIADMVLQGTFASPAKWEVQLREDLTLSAHSASLISLPTENVAIVADMKNWDVKLISSQVQSLPYSSGMSGPVGMSLLVSSMLETVHTMNSSGISAYECLSFLESKLQEIYLQSESLAAFLLATDFCPLSAVTSALNLSENDIPLLLSVASIHTPQISKKCGISFR